MKYTSGATGENPEQCPVCGRDLRADDAAIAADGTCSYCGSPLWDKPVESRESRTKKRVERLANEMLDLSKRNISVNSLLPAFLDRLVTAMGALAGAIWCIDDDGLISLVCHRQLAGELWDATRHESHEQILRNACAGDESELDESESIVLPNATIEGAGPNPTGALLILYRFQTKRLKNAVIEVFQRPNGPEDANRGYLMFLQQMGGFLRKSPALARDDSEAS